MAVTSTISIAALSLVSLVALLFVLDGYRLRKKLLAWIGWIAGAGAGGAIGWITSTTTASGPDPIIAAGGALLIGAIIGRIVVPLVSWLAIVLLGFISTSILTGLVLAGRQLANTVSQLDFTISSTQDLQVLIDQLAATPVLHNQQVLAITAVAGLVGAVLASRYYALIVTTAVTTIGAALLAVVAPLWQRALNGGLALTETTPTDISTSVFATILVGGLLVQAFRYRAELDLPFTDSDDYDPLEGQ